MKKKGYDSQLRHRLAEYQEILKQTPILYEAAEATRKAGKTSESVQEIVALFVAAPVLCRFVWWVLLEAEKKGTRRLYFLARDGWFLYQIAQVFCKAADVSVECRYLYCSRYAFRSAEYHLLGKESLSYLCLGGIDVTFEKVMQRAGFNEEEKKEMAELLGYKGKTDVPLTYMDLCALKTKLSECRPFLEKLFAYAEKNYPTVMGYFRQEGLFDKVSFAIVDSGWTGSMQKSLSLLLKSAGWSGTIEGYYFGMYGWPKEADLASYHIYYFTPLGNLRRKAYFSNNLFECMFSAPTGMTKGYEYTDGRYIPVFEHPQNPNAEKLQQTEQYLLQYAKELTAYLKKKKAMQEFGTLRVTEQLLYCFMGHPTETEAREYGSYVFCDDVIGEDKQTLAANFSLQELKENHLLPLLLRRFGKSKKKLKESAWIEGSAVLVERAKKWELWHCALCKYARAIKKSREAWLIWREWKAEKP